MQVITISVDNTLDIWGANWKACVYVRAYIPNKNSHYHMSGITSHYSHAESFRNTSSEGNHFDELQKNLATQVSHLSEVVKIWQPAEARMQQGACIGIVADTTFECLQQIKYMNNHVPICYCCSNCSTDHSWHNTNHTKQWPMCTYWSNKISTNLSVSHCLQAKLLKWTD